MVAPASSQPTESLAEHVLAALTGDGTEFRLWSWLGAQPSESAALAALRALGADALTPFVLAGHPFDADDAALVGTALRAYPAPEQAGERWPARDWALRTVLLGLGVDRAELDDCGLPDEPATAAALAAPWPRFCATMAALSALALPTVDEALHGHATRRQLDLARGLTRAMLHRDHLGAARLARWLACAATDGDESGVVRPALRHLDFHATDRPRVQLEIVVARRLLRRTALVGT